MWRCFLSDLSGNWFETLKPQQFSSLKKLRTLWVFTISIDSNDSGFYQISECVSSVMPRIVIVYILPGKFIL